MEPKPTRLQHRQETVGQTSQQKGGQEFTSVEELLRHDAAQTEVPETVAHRLASSISKEPKPARSWWRRLFS